MGDGGSLIDLSGLSKPATVLIEKVSEAVGGIAKPWQTRRVARAEADAEIIRAQARVEISEIEERALIRMVREEGKKQENIEGITEKAIPHLSDDAKPDQIEKDWISHFFDRARLTSDEEMQGLWASILAGQSNKPGSFSKRTIDLVASIEKSDAELFTRLCTYCWMFGGVKPIIDNVNNEVFKNSGIRFVDLVHLDSIGLISFDNIGRFSLNGLGKYLTIFYYGRAIVIEFPSEDNNSFVLGNVVLTRAGLELAPICEPTPSSVYMEHVLSSWIEKGYAISCPVSSKETWMKPM